MQLLAATIACLVVFAVAPVRAAEHEEEGAAPPAQTPGASEPVPAPIADQPYGWQMMTPEERAAHCNAMRAATSPEQREQLRAAHHAQMAARASQRGIAMPETPPQGGGPGAGCRGMLGPAPGAGMGMGRGGPGPPP